MKKYIFAAVSGAIAEVTVLAGLWITTNMGLINMTLLGITAYFVGIITSLFLQERKARIRRNSRRRKSSPSLIYVTLDKEEWYHGRKAG